MAEAITDIQISGYIQAIQKSGALGKSERRLRLLEHLIRAEVAGQGGSLKAYAIGLDVFDKSETFDPTSDSIVRVEIGRLRTAIALFEASDYADTELRIDIPVGTYRPTLTRRIVAIPAPRKQHPKPVVAPTSNRSLLSMLALAVIGLAVLMTVFWPVEDQNTGAIPDKAAITVLMQEFEGDPRMSKRANSIIARALMRSPTFNVIDDVPLNLRPDSDDATYVLSGYIEQNSTSGFRLDIELVDFRTAKMIWSKTSAIYENAQIETEIESLFSSELRVRLFGAAKRVLEDRDLENLSPEELFVMATWVPGAARNAAEWEQERIALMRLVLKKDPDFGTAHSVMADKLRYLANVHEPADTPEATAAAEYHIQRALELAPLNADAMFNVAQAQWHGGHTYESIATMDRVLELNRGHQLAAYLRLVTPYTCAVPPDETIQDALAFDQALSADNPIRWLTLTWIAWLYSNQEQYELALEYEEQAALIFQIPYTFMRHAMILNMLGRTEDAATVLQKQEVNWPTITADFFASTTYPRLCSATEQAQKFIAPYEKLARDLKAG